MAKRRPQQLEEWRPPSRVHKNRFLTEAQFKDARQRAIIDMVGFMLSNEKAKFIEKAQRKAAMPEQAKGSTSNPLLVTQEDYQMREVRDLTFFVPVNYVTEVVMEPDD